MWEWTVDASRAKTALRVDSPQRKASSTSARSAQTVGRRLPQSREHAQSARSGAFPCALPDRTTQGPTAVVTRARTARPDGLRSAPKPTGNARSALKGGIKAKTARVCASCVPWGNFHSAPPIPRMWEWTVDASRAKTALRVVSPQRKASSMSARSAQKVGRRLPQSREHAQSARSGAFPCALPDRTTQGPTAVVTRARTALRGASPQSRKRTTVALSVLTGGTKVMMPWAFA
jgi:hypothetical protein